MRHWQSPTHPRVCCPSFTYPRVACFPPFSSAIIREVDEVKVLNCRVRKVVLMLSHAQLCGRNAGVVDSFISRANPVQMFGVDRKSDKGANVESRTTRIDVWLQPKQGARNWPNK